MPGALAHLIGLRKYAEFVKNYNLTNDGPPGPIHELITFVYRYIYASCSNFVQLIKTRAG